MAHGGMERRAGASRGHWRQLFRQERASSREGKMSLATAMCVDGIPSASRRFSLTWKVLSLTATNATYTAKAGLCEPPLAS